MTDNAKSQIELELAAIEKVVTALESLDSDRQIRVLQYASEVLKISAPIPPAKAGKPAPLASDPPPPTEPTSATKVGLHATHTTDIRSFTENKQPRSANEMAAVVAYFLQYEAPEEERKESITAEDIVKYFHLAKYTKPSNPNMTLTHSKNSGYLDQQERGQYKLNAVGYNFVTHKLPSDGTSSRAVKPRKLKSKTPKTSAKPRTKAKAKPKT